MSDNIERILEGENTNAESNVTPSIHGRDGATTTQASTTPTATNESVGNENIVKKRKLTSPAWEHFKKVIIKGQNKAECVHCRKHLGGESRNGTRHLLDHIKNCPMMKQKDTKQMILKGSEGKSSIETYHFNSEVSRYKLGRMIVLHEYPLSIVDHEGFRAYSNSLQPLFKVPCRNTIRADIFKMYEAEKLKLRRVLEDVSSRITITTDMWTANNQKRGYMVITAHFIDNSWTLQDRIMRFMYVPSPHDAESLGEVLMECLLDWNIELATPGQTQHSQASNISHGTTL